MLLGESFHPGGTALTKQLAEMALAGPDDRVVDVACGTGTTAHILALEFGAQVLGIDYSAVMIDRANRQWTSPDYRYRPSFCRGNVFQLPVATASQDIVFCECALCTFIDPMLALNEFLRVLKPGGRIALSDITIDKPIPAALQNILAHNICVAGAHSVKQYQSMISEAGFSTIRTKLTNHVLFDMIERIERRLELSEVMLELQQSALADESSNARQTLTDARDFLSSGGAGYALFSARK